VKGAGDAGNAEEGIAGIADWLSTLCAELEVAQEDIEARCNRVFLVSSAEFRVYDDSRSLRQVLLRQAVVFDSSDLLQFDLHYTYLSTP